MYHEGPERRSKERKVLDYDKDKGEYWLRSKEASPSSPDQRIQQLILDIDGTLLKLFTTNSKKDWPEFGKLSGNTFNALLMLETLAKTIFVENKRFEKEAIRRLQVQKSNITNQKLNVFLEQQKEDFDWLSEELQRALSPKLWEEFLYKAMSMSVRFDESINQELALINSRGVKLSIATDSVLPGYRMELLRLIHHENFGESRIWTSKDMGYKKSDQRFFERVAGELGIDETQRALLIDDLPINIANAEKAGFAIARVRNLYSIKQVLGII